MTTNDLLELDCRKEENKKKLHSAVMKVFCTVRKSDIEYFTIEDIEELLFRYQKKYKLCLDNISPAYHNADHTVYTARVWLEGKAHAQFIYAISMLELFSKILVYMFSQVKAGKVDKRK